MSGVCLVERVDIGLVSLVPQLWVDVIKKMLSQSSISVPFPREPDEYVLDLTVRPGSDNDSHSRSFQRYQEDEDLRGMDLCHRGALSPRRRGAPQIMSPLHVQDTGYNTTMAILQQRFLEDKLRSPRFGSEHGGSLRSSSPSLSPSYVSPPPTAPTTTRSGKPTRPFKAYPKDPLNMVNSVVEGISTSSNEAYSEFRKRMLEHVHAATGGNAGNKNMRRPVQSLSPTSQTPSSSMDGNGKDSAYWERRRKNNEAAKRSRDARRAKEDEIAIRAAFLEQENVKLKYEVAALRNETNRLRCMLFSN